jgi:hypothetical protein
MIGVTLGGAESWTRILSREAAPAFTGPLLLVAGTFFLCWGAATLGTARVRTPRSPRACTWH